MPNGFKPRGQFQQYSYDKFEQITKVLDRLPCQKEGYDIPERLHTLELESKWYKNIFAGAWAITGGAVVVAFRYYLNKKKRGE